MPSHSDPQHLSANNATSLSRDVAGVNFGLSSGHNNAAPSRRPETPVPQANGVPNLGTFVPPGRRGTPTQEEMSATTVEVDSVEARAAYMMTSTPSRVVKTATSESLVATVSTKKSPWTVQKTSSKLSSHQPQQCETLEEHQKSAMRLKNSQKELIVLEQTLTTMKNLLLERRTLSTQENQLLEKSADFVATVLDVKLPVEIIYLFAKSQPQGKLDDNEIKDLAAKVGKELVIKQELTKEEKEALEKVKELHEKPTQPSSREERKYFEAAKYIYIEQVIDEIDCMESKIKAIRKREYHKMKAFVIEALLASKRHVAAGFGSAAHQEWRKHVYETHANFSNLENCNAPILFAQGQMKLFRLFSPANIPVSQGGNMGAEFHSSVLETKQP